MTPDAFMPLYGSDFFEAIVGYSDAVGMAYIRALWHYWRHNHCAGLPDDDDYLSRVCRSECWETVKPIVFGELFQLDDGKWHQSRARDEYQKACSKYTRRVAQTAAARVRSSKANSVTYPVTDHVTGYVTDPVTDPVTGVQSESESESESGTEVQTNKRGTGRYPTLNEAKAHAAFIGMSDSDAEKFWHHFESSGWIDKNGHQIARWQSKMATWRSNIQAAPLEAAHKAAEGYSSNVLTGADKMILSKELDRVETMLRQLRDGAAADAMGQKYFSEQDKRRISQLITKRNEIRTKLGL